MKLLKKEYRRPEVGCDIFDSMDVLCASALDASSVNDYEEVTFEW